MTGQGRSQHTEAVTQKENTMNVTMIALLAAAILAAPGAYAQSQSAAAPATGARSYYYWLHPRLGMVKVDSKTNFMLVGRRAQQASVTP
jgi:hypothetical protein